MYLYMFSLCCSQKRQDNFFVKTEVKHFQIRVSKMHKLIPAGSSRESLRVEIPFVYAFHVLFSS